MQIFSMMVHVDATRTRSSLKVIGQSSRSQEEKCSFRVKVKLKLEKAV